MRRFLAWILIFTLIQTPLQALAEENTQGLDISAKTGILVEAESGKVIMEKQADMKLPPASVTKIMTLILIFDDISNGKLRFDEEVQVSEYAASMGGSQVFLEEGERQTVDTMIKCIAVASANDACVAMAEKICGSEEEFVKRMNKRAKSLGMKNTNFVNCNGLDTDGHETTARDISLMSRKLLLKYPKIQEYSKIWMEDIVHHTRKGDKKFTITNTNKFIRTYEYATGLKTGSTGKAGFCLSASAEKDHMKLIAVLMAEPDSKTRLKDVISMLDYGYSKCERYQDDKSIKKTYKAKVNKGIKNTVKGSPEQIFSYVHTGSEPISDMKSKVYYEKLSAPVHVGDKIGRIVYFLGENSIGEIDIKAGEEVKKMTFAAAFTKVTGEYFLSAK